MVTSNAVVGSSAKRMAGSPARAMASTLRWRMPAGQEGALCAALGELLRGAAAVTVSPPHFAPF